MAAVDFNMLMQSIISTGINVIFSAVIIIVLFSVGFFVATFINKIIRKAMLQLRIEGWLADRGLDRALLGFSLTDVITVILKVYIVFVFLGWAADIVDKNFYTMGFIKPIIMAFLNYIPHFVSGMIIIMIALYLAAFISNTIKREHKFFLSGQVSLGLKLLIAYIAVIIALPELLPGVDTTVLQKLLELFISAIILAVGLAVGLAFGLGMKDSIAKAAAKRQDAIDEAIAAIWRKK